MAEPSTYKDGTWQDNLFITVTRLDGSDVDFHAKINEVGFSGGDKNIEGQPLMNGGRIRQNEAQEDFEFTGTMYPEGVSAEDAYGLMQWLMGSEDQNDSSDAISEFVNRNERPDLRIVVLLTNDSDIESATDEVSGEDVKALRWIYTNATCASAVPNFDDQIWTTEFTFQIPPKDENGESNVRVQEYRGDSSDSLDALDSYESS